MRKILIDLLLIAAAMTLVCTTADARRHGAQDRSQRISREELILVQVAHIADRLDLDKKTTERFTETYCSFQQEIWNLGPRPGRLSPDAGEEETGRIPYPEADTANLPDRAGDDGPPLRTRKRQRCPWPGTETCLRAWQETLKNISYSGTSISLCSDKTAALIMHAALRLPSPFLPEADFVLFSFSPFHSL